ncbi:winged helix-turn-helix domain-containing protein [Micromonospora aurantiaca (nom. illeg.)]|uniref:winged helix-turn-helix domain-containing protein n=1 Tax=Micromonospora aurantiaca (nom. illeg.) TaxID=47850 RepID=UPI0036B003C1
MDKQQPRRVTQVEILKSFSHPLRLRLYYALAKRGSATATVLAKDIGTTAQLAFYHLNRMAELGVLEEDSHTPARGRERYWRQSTQGLSFTTEDLGADTLSDLEALHRGQAGIHFEQLQAFFATGPDPDDQFRNTAFGSDMVLALNRTEVDLLRQQLTDLLLRFRNTPHPPADNDEGDEDRRDVFVFVHAFPMR